MTDADKKETLAAIREALRIAEGLYRLERAKYKESFAWINSMVKQKKRPSLILRAMRSLEQKHLAGGPAGSTIEYLQGTMRRIEQEGVPAKIRAVETLGQIMDRAHARRSGDGR